MMCLLCSSTGPASLIVRSKAEIVPSRYVSESLSPSAAAFWSSHQMCVQSLLEAVRMKQSIDVKFSIHCLKMLVMQAT